MSASWEIKSMYFIVFCVTERWLDEEKNKSVIEMESWQKLTYAKLVLSNCIGQTQTMQVKLVICTQKLWEKILISLRVCLANRIVLTSFFFLVGTPHRCSLLAVRRPTKIDGWSWARSEQTDLQSANQIFFQPLLITRYLWWMGENVVEWENVPAEVLDSVYTVSGL